MKKDCAGCKDCKDSADSKNVLFLDGRVFSLKEVGADKYSVTMDSPKNKGKALKKEKEDPIVPSMEEIEDMGRAELAKLCKDLKLSIDPKEYKNTPKLMDAILEEIGEMGEDEDVEKHSKKGKVDVSSLEPEDIEAMNRKEMIEIIESNNLDIDYKKLKNPKSLSNALIDELFEEKDESEGADGDDDESEDESEDGGDAESIDVEDIEAMDQQELVDLVKEYDIDVNPKDYKSTSKLRKAILEALGD